jgi:inosine-uridine nucleoside N-ribohydrolase
MGIGLYGQFVPGPLRDNGSTLYNTDHLIPRATQADYRFRGNRGRAFGFVLAEDIVLDKLATSRGRVVVLNTGKLTTFARVLAKASAAELRKIGEVVIMGGGFQGREPFTAAHPAACFGDKSLNLGGNIFSHPSFACDTDFSTHQEFNIFLDPTSAKWAFDLLAEKRIPTRLIPTNATDDAKVQLATIDQLAAAGGTPESCYTSRLLTEVREFEGGDFNGNGDFALEAVIRLWDIMAALVLLDPALATVVEPWFVDVDQLDPGLAQSATPYDPITFDPRVGKTTLRAEGAGKKVDVVLAIQTEVARQAMIDRLRDRFNSAVRGERCGRRP